MSSVSFAQPDVTLKLDLSGVIRLAVLSGAISGETISDWVGRPWAETVAGPGNTHVRRMIEDARTTGLSSFHQVRQRFPSGLELSVEYTTVRLGGDGGLIAIGRNLEAVAELRSRLVAAQASMERDYWKLREVETRYRLLFDASTQPVLMLGADDMRIKEANPAAIRALGVASGSELLPEILPAERNAFETMLARVREQGKAPGIVVHLGQDRQPWLLRAALVAAEPAAVFVLQLSASAVVLPIESSGPVRFADLMARLPEAFAVVDLEGKIVTANRAFLGLVNAASESAVVGERLGRWLAPSGAGVDALLGARASSVLSLRGDRGAVTEVEVSVTRDSDANHRYVGLLLRRVLSEGMPGKRQPGASPAKRLGKLTMREIVQETVDSVERSCVEAALERAKGNRTVAAQMLGLSRQSLYMKIERYSLSDETPKSAK
jgi:transcriptional regulator PpsR